MPCQLYLFVLQYQDSHYNLYLILGMALSVIRQADFLDKFKDVNFIRDMHQQTKALLYSSKDFEEIHKILQKQIQLEKIYLEQEDTCTKKKGRGGNNIAQNVKKSLLAIFRQCLPKTLAIELNQRFIVPYSLKSQKENIVLFFLFLHIFVREGKIKQEVVQSIQEELIFKIDKYIINSCSRIQGQEWRRQFHQKNIIEFEKFKRLDLDFTRPRKLQDITNQIGRFYLKKKVQAKRAQERLLKIIKRHNQLLQLFPEAQQQKITETEASIEKQQNYCFDQECEII